MPPASPVTTLTLPDGQTYLGDGVLSGAQHLRTVVIPASVETIADDAFRNCPALERVIFLGDASRSTKNAGMHLHFDSEVILSCHCSGTGWEDARTEMAEEYGILWEDLDAAAGSDTLRLSIGTETLPVGGTARITASFDPQYAIDFVWSSDAPDIAADVQPGTYGENLEWNFDPETGTLTIIGTGKMADYDLTPCPWSRYQQSIQLVVIEDGVTSIGNRAFYSYTSLVSVTLPDSVTSIGECSFHSCTEMTSITFLNADCEIYDDAKTLSNDFKNGDPFYTGVIRGCEGSTAQAYAEKYGYTFDALNAATEPVTEPTEPVTEPTEQPTEASTDPAEDTTIDLTDMIKIETEWDPSNRINKNGSEITSLKIEADFWSLHKEVYFTKLEMQFLFDGKTSDSFKDRFRRSIPLDDYGWICDEQNNKVTIAIWPDENGRLPEFHYWFMDYYPTPEDFSEGEHTITIILTGTTDDNKTLVPIQVEETFYIEDGPAPTEPEPPLGDIDGTGTVNASDAANVLIAAAAIGASKDPGLTDAQKKAADVNGDGAINATDAAIILQYAAAVGAGHTDAKITDFVKKA